MRTTVRLNENLLRRAKQYALEHHKTLTAVIEDSLQRLLRSKEASPKRRRVKLPTFGHGGVMPGVDLDNTASLMDIMDEKP